MAVVNTWILALLFQTPAVKILHTNFHMRCAFLLTLLLPIVTLSSVVVIVPSVINPPAVVQTLYTCDIGAHAACNVSMHCAGQIDPQIGEEYWDPLITKVVVYRYTAPNAGLFRFSTENPSTTCKDTYLMTQYPKRCSDDVALTQETMSRLDLNLTAEETITAYVGSYENTCTEGQTVSLTVSLIGHSMPPSTMTPTAVAKPTRKPSKTPTAKPSKRPSPQPTAKPTTLFPTRKPSLPTKEPTANPSKSPTTRKPTTAFPTKRPSKLPTSRPTEASG